VSSETKKHGQLELVYLLNASKAHQDDDHEWEYDRFGCDDSPGLVVYLIDRVGVWLSFREDLSPAEIEGMTGYGLTEIAKVAGSRPRRWGLRTPGEPGLATPRPLLRFPFTLRELRLFHQRTGMCTAGVECVTEDETQTAIDELLTRSADAAELARALLSDGATAPVPRLPPRDELTREHTKLKASCRNHTKVLAEKYGVSTAYIRKLVAPMPAVSTPFDGLRRTGKPTRNR